MRLYVEPYPCRPNRYKWKVAGSGDMKMMEKLNRWIAGATYKITELRPGVFQYWVRKGRYVEDVKKIH